jgi:glutamate synthase (NADPH) small chain
LMYETNPLPEICGRVCPQDRLCEQACTLNTGFGAVTIGSIEKNISDRAMQNNWRPNLEHVSNKKYSIGIVGAGPAGLACADQLARNGYQAVVYDQYPEIGGLLTFGIPSFKLEKEVIRKRRKFLEDIGVKFHLNTKIGETVSFDQLQKDHDKLFLAMGTYKSVQTPLVGIDAMGVIDALDYLIGSTKNLEGYQMDNFPYSNLKGKTVIVIGGGDTAMDCVRTAIRQGAENVKCVYRRDKASMPGSPNEVSNAIEEGVTFVFNYAPESIITNQNNQVIGLNVLQTKLSLSDENVEKLTTVADSKISIEADIIITAFGFRASPPRWFAHHDLQLEKNGLVMLTQPNQQQTSLKHVLAGGDMVRGADLVVTAIADGIKAANEIMTSLS